MRYVVLYPRVQIHMLIFLVVFVTRIVVPAYWMLGYWFLMQVFSGFGSIGADAAAWRSGRTSAASWPARCW